MTTSEADGGRFEAFDSRYIEVETNYDALIAGEFAIVSGGLVVSELTDVVTFNEVFLHGNISMGIATVTTAIAIDGSHWLARKFDTPYDPKFRNLAGKAASLIAALTPGLMKEWSDAGELNNHFSGWDMLSNSVGIGFALAHRRLVSTLNPNYDPNS